MSDPIIRPYDPQWDLESASTCFYEGFHHILWPILDHASPSLVRDFLRLMLRASPCSLVAESGEGVGAILFGAAPMEASGLARSALFGALRIAPRLSLNRYYFNRLSYGHLAWLAYGFAPFFWRHPTAWPLAEINLFTSRRSFRGKGTGRMLMDAFMAEARRQGLPGAYVCTDTSLSYHFYEAYGFSKAGAFPMKAYRLSLPDQEHEARIYHYSFQGTG